MDKKYVRVMDGLKSNANGFEFKLDEVNMAKRWNPSSLDAQEMGGFNFGTEDKILRWLHRGDTLYDVIVPEDAEVVLVDDVKGVYRANKIIITNPRTITNELVLDLYKKTTLPDKIISHCLVTLLWRDRFDICKYIIKDRVNLSNIDVFINGYEDYISRDYISSNDLDEKIEEIHNILKEIKDPLSISLYVDKDVYIKDITDDKVINITGESGSGKSYYANKYLNDNDYIVIDTDLIFGDCSTDNKEVLEIRELFKNRDKKDLITDFDNCYLDILNYFKDRNKTIVIDSAQYRNIKDYSILKGRVIVMRTCVDISYERCINRFKETNPNYTKEELDKYSNKKLGMYEWYKSLNKFIKEIDKL